MGVKKSSFTTIGVHSFEARAIVSAGSGPSPFLETTVSSPGVVSPESDSHWRSGVPLEPPGPPYHSEDGPGVRRSLTWLPTPWDEVLCCSSRLGVNCPT